MGLVVYKLGGSLLSCVDLATRLRAVLEQRPDDRSLIVVGGGAAADVVRDWSRIHGLSEAVHELYKLPLSNDPRTTLSVGTISGGTSVNSIAANADLRALAEAILEIHAADPNARFVIEGHTSTDGGAEENRVLSAQRASRTHALLVSSFGVPAAILTTQGYGEDYAEFPNGSEEQLQQDRRVLVVRTQ